MTIEKPFTGGMEGLSPFISSTSEPSPALEKRTNITTTAGSSSTSRSHVVATGGRLKRKKASSNNKTGESTSNNKSISTLGGGGGGKKPRINIESVVKQFTSSVNVTTSKQQRMGSNNRKNPEVPKRLKFVMTERTNLSPVKKQSTGKDVGVDAIAAAAPLDLDATSPQHPNSGGGGGGQESQVDLHQDPQTHPSVPTPPTKTTRARRKASKVMPRKRSKDDHNTVGLRKSMRLLVRSNRSEASRVKRAPCPASPFGRTVELLSVNDGELNRDCEITKILFLSSLSVIPTFARPSAEDRVGSLRTLCIRSHIRHLELLKHQKDQETKLLIDKSSSDDESSSSLSVSSNDTEQNSPSDREDDDEWVNFEESIRRTPTESISKSDLQSAVKDCVTKLLQRGNVVDFAGSTPPYLADIIRKMSPKVVHQQDNKDDDDEWISWDDQCDHSTLKPLNSATSLREKRSPNLKIGANKDTSRKGQTRRINHTKKSSSSAKILSTSALLTAM